MKTKTIKLFFTALLSVSILSGCLKDNDDINNIPKAAFTMVNAYSPASSIVHLADNSYLVSPSAPLNYNQYTNYPKFLYTGNRKIKTISVDNKVLMDTVYTFRDSSYYTSFVFGTTDKPKQIIAEDIGVEDLNNKSALRFFHLANNTAKVNVYLNSKENPIYSNRTIEDVLIGESIEHAKFIGQNSGTNNIIITDENGITLIERSFSFAQGKYYTIILTGDKNSQDKPLYIGIVEQY